MDNSKIGHHISEQFNKELEDIRNKVLVMGGLVERQIEQAIEAYTTGNMELAEQVIKQDNDVDLLEIAIDQECTQILALRQHYFSCFCVQELPKRIEQFKCIPLPRVMAGRKNNSSLCFIRCNSYLHGGGGRKAQVNYVDPHSHKRSAYQVVHHNARHPCIAPYHHGDLRGRVRINNICGKACNKFYNICRCKVITRFSAYSAPDS